MKTRAEVATEYTKIAVQCWKDENKKLEAQLAARTYTWTTARPTPNDFEWILHGDVS